MGPQTERVSLGYVIGVNQRSASEPVQSHQQAEAQHDDGIGWQWQPQHGESDFYDSLVRAVLRHTPPRSRVLEVGVGAGYLPTQLALQAKCNCIGIDILPDAIQASRQTAEARGAKLQLLRGSGFALPFPDSVFDVVMSLGVIEHFPPARSQLMLAEHARVCRRGGAVIVSVPNSLDLLHGLTRLVLGRRYAFFPERSYSRWSLARALRAAGLEPTAADGYAPLWSLRQARFAYPLTAIMHKTGVLTAASGLRNPFLLSLVGNLTLQVARKPGEPGDHHQHESER